MFAIRVGQLQRSGRVWGARSGPWVAPFRLSLVHPDWSIGGSLYFILPPGRHSHHRGGSHPRGGQGWGTAWYFYTGDFGLVSDIPARDHGGL